MLEEVTADALIEVGAADGAVCERLIIKKRKEAGKLYIEIILTRGYCGGCDTVFCSPSITQ